MLQAGDLLAFDTDLVGPNGYCSDISRTWLVGDGRPSDEQRKLYEFAYAQVHFNMNLLRPRQSEGGSVMCRRLRRVPLAGRQPRHAHGGQHQIGRPFSLSGSARFSVDFHLIRPSEQRSKDQDE